MDKDPQLAPKPEETEPTWTTLDAHSDGATIYEVLIKSSQAGGWWTPESSKGVHDLIDEITSGESTVSFSSSGEVRRRVNVAYVEVIYTDAHGIVYRLKEDRQEFVNGRTRIRNMSTSLGEKIKLNETPEQAAMRAIREEIGISDVVSLNSVGETEYTRPSDSYPGLSSEYKGHGFVAVIDDGDFNLEGYVEVQKDKTNYYVWEEIKGADA